mmetsp:Transcript_84955/g.147367  ORF Transcript_84955/g.147367 Transcript_84955/m.147367 type:complete len:253 (+) Transcript_84955:74-832(+)
MCVHTPLMTTSLLLLLTSIASTTQEDVHEGTTRCEIAAVPHRRCLIQRERLETAAALQSMAVSSSEARQRWPREEVIIDFTAGSADMANVQRLSMQNFDYDGVNVVNVSKEYTQLTFTPMRGTADDPVKNGARLYGFTNKTGGISNVNQQRFWSRKPTSEGAQLMYQISLLRVPGAAQWRYNITFAQDPPSSLKVEPSNGIAYKIGEDLFVKILCDSVEQCGDDSILISQVKFSPFGGYNPHLEDPIDESQV